MHNGSFCRLSRNYLTTSEITKWQAPLRSILTAEEYHLSRGIPFAAACIVPCSLLSWQCLAKNWCCTFGTKRPVPSSYIFVKAQRQQRSQLVGGSLLQWQLGQYPFACCNLSMSEISIFKESIFESDSVGQCLDFIRAPYRINLDIS